MISGLISLSLLFKTNKMNEHITTVLSQAIQAKLEQGPRFRFDGSVEDVFDRVVYLDDLIPVVLEEFSGLYDQILSEHQSLSAEEIDMELVTLTKEQLQLPY